MKRLVVERKGESDVQSEASWDGLGERYPTRSNEETGSSMLRWAGVGEDKMSIRNILN